MGTLKSKNEIKVLLTTEGTYPFYQGGVSTWCDMLIKGLKNVDFHIVSITPDPFVTQKFTLPVGSKLIRVPLWGTDEPSEHLDVPFSSTYLAKTRTTEDVIQNKFIPLFDGLVRQILAREKEPTKLGTILLQLYELFRQYDYKSCFKSEFTWERYKLILEKEVENPATGWEQPDVYSLIQSLGWLYRFFNVINTNVPRTSIAHSTAAAFCGLPCVISKLKYGTPYLLTEHGVYLREQYLSLSKRGYSSFLNTFLIRMIWSVVNLNYFYADQISPVCVYNTRWEKRLTDRTDRIRVIYNGVNHRLFEKIVPRSMLKQPIVVVVARIDPIKDLLTMIRVADVVRNTIPDVLFLVYGSVSVPTYFDECQALVEELALNSVVKFQGHITDLTTIYNDADLVLQTSISEAFPYAVVEAMFAGKCVVATGVGGTPEAIGNTGVIVNPGDVDDIANSISDLLVNHERRLEMGEEARSRAYDLFTVETFLSEYLRSYIRLSVVKSSLVGKKSENVQQRDRSLRSSDVSTNNEVDYSDWRMSSSRNRRLAMEKAMALLMAGYPVQGTRHLQASIRSQSPKVSDVVKQALLERIYSRLDWQEYREKATAELQLMEESFLKLKHQLWIEKAYAFEANEATHWAIQYFERAVDTKPNAMDMITVLTELGRLYEKIGNQEKVKETKLRIQRMQQLAQ